MTIHVGVVRMFVFIVTIFSHPPGLWLFPNLFADVGFFDSFKPWYAWHLTNAEKERRKAEKKRLRLEKQKRKEEKRKMRELRKNEKSNSEQETK